MTANPSLPPSFTGLRLDERGVPVLDAPVVRRFRFLIHGYYLRHGRTFAWRETRDPYHILVSELMLQQTQAQRVATKYPEFLARFPTLRSLAAASTLELLAAWSGLGYNRRALALRETARRLLEDHGGVVPADPAVLATLPGIGAATASEIAAFAHDVASPLIETNIRRVYLHFFFLGREGISDTQILPLVERTLDRVRPRVWYYALMDYGVMMKQAFPAAATSDPNRRSAHYARQPRFEGSDRQIRGRVLRILADGSRLTDDELLARLAAVRDPAGPRSRGGRPGRASLPGGERLGRILGDLATEGFLARQRGRLRLP